MDEPPEQPADPRLEQVIRQTRIAVGASDRMPVRVMVLFIASAIHRR
jgi:hypothetical protein